MTYDNTLSLGSGHLFFQATTVFISPFALDQATKLSAPPSIVNALCPLH